MHQAKRGSILIEPVSNGYKILVQSGCIGQEATELVAKSRTGVANLVTGLLKDLEETSLGADKNVPNDPNWQKAKQVQRR